MLDCRVPCLCSPWLLPATLLYCGITLKSSINVVRKSRSSPFLFLLLFSFGVWNHSEKVSCILFWKLENSQLSSMVALWPEKLLLWVDSFDTNLGPLEWIWLCCSVGRRNCCRKDAQAHGLLFFWPQSTCFFPHAPFRSPRASLCSVLCKVHALWVLEFLLSFFSVRECSSHVQSQPSFGQKHSLF